MSKRIIIVNQYGGHYKYHNYKRTSEIAEGLVKQGNIVDVVCANVFHNTRNINDKKFEIIDGVNYYYIKIGRSSRNLFRLFNMALFSIKSYMKILRMARPDVVYCSIQSIFTGLIGTRLKRKGIKFILEVRDLWPETLIQFKKTNRNSLFSIIFRRIEKKIYLSSDIIISTMKNINLYMSNILRIDVSSKIHYVNNGVNIYRYNLILQKFPLTFALPSGFNVVYTGSIGDSNEINLILEIANLLKMSRINFLFFGEGNLKNDYITYAEEMKIDNVYFYDRISYENIPGLLKETDCLILTIKNIGLYDYGLSMNKIFDYLASGIPIVSNTLDSGDDIIGNAGWYSLNKNATAQEISNKIIEISHLDDVELLQKRVYASKYLANNYDYKILCNKIIKLI